MNKEILRLCYETQKKEWFVASGVWSNGYNAYSKLSMINGKPTILDDDDCAYYQTRINGHLVMVHI